MSARGGRVAIRAGTPVATHTGMAAVLCLMFLPLMFGALFMLGSMGSMSLGVVMAAGTFLMLGGGLVYGTLRLATSWEGEH